MQRQDFPLLAFAAFLVLPLAVTGGAFAASPDVAEYKDFGREVAQVVSAMKEVAASDREQSDLRAIEFLLRDYNQAVAAKNWREADLAKERMRVSLIRGGAVAAEAGKRKADQARADTERRHREVMQQRERQHREAMEKQQELINRVQADHARIRH
jgi:hypothetical protein